MESIKLNIKFWLIGVIVGVIVVERWRRYGKRSVLELVGVSEDVEVSSVTAAPSASADKPKVSASIATGVKADAQRVKRLIGRTTPETAGSSPSTSTSP